MSLFWIRDLFKAVHNMDIHSRKPSVLDLPEEILEQILFNLSPYNDLKSAREVCKQWHRLVQGVIKQLHQNLHRAVQESRVMWRGLAQDSGPTIAERYSHCSAYFDKSVYVFGGCTSTSTTFNDLWRFDLATRHWIRPLAMGTYPSPKACASLVVYRENLVLFGGWSHPSPYPLHQAARFFNELHIYTPKTNRWSHVLTQISPRPTAGHSACVLRDKMVVFGGCHSPGVGCNDTWVFDFVQMTWEKQTTIPRRPSPRYGQSQLTLDDSHILVLGGCGGPNQIFNDLWLLHLTDDLWEWSQVSVANGESSPAQLWCHPACKIGNTAVVLSKTNRLGNPVAAASQPPGGRHAPVLAQAPPPGHAPALRRAQVKLERVWVPPREELLPGVEGERFNTGDDNTLVIAGDVDISPPPLTPSNLGVGSKRKISMMARAGAGSSSGQDSSSDEGTESLPRSRNLRHCHAYTARSAAATSGQSHDGSGVRTGSDTTDSVRHNPSLPGPSGYSNRASTSGGSKTDISGRRQENTTDGATNSPGTCGSAGVRPGLPSIRPHAMNIRSKQLDALKRHADRIKQLVSAAGTTAPAQWHASRHSGSPIGRRAPSLGSPTSKRKEIRANSPTREAKTPMFFHVLDLSKIVSSHEASWFPLTDCSLPDAPEETVFYSLVEGRGELLMFGGIQKDLSSMQIGADIEAHVVSNDLYVISSQ